MEGGSTITQQLAKNLYFSQEKEMTRKVAEMFMAFDLERHYSKEEILELYVNTIYFGNGYYSVAEASEGYFGKAPSEMTEYESTLLAGIPNAPSVYALTANPDWRRSARDRWCSAWWLAATIRRCRPRRRWQRECRLKEYGDFGRKTGIPIVEKAQALCAEWDKTRGHRVRGLFGEGRRGKWGDREENI